MTREEALRRAIRARMGEVGIESLVAMAERCGVSRQLLASWLAAPLKPPRPSPLARMAKALGTSPTALKTAADAIRRKRGE